MQAVSSANFRSILRISLKNIVKVSCFSIISLAFFVVLTLFAPQALALLKIPAAAKGAGTVYIRICAAGVVFISAYNAISGLFRGVGDSKMPFVFILIACIVNIIGDLALVGLFKMGAAGAALATVLAQTVSVIFSVIYILKGGLPFKFLRGVKAEEMETG